MLKKRKKLKERKRGEKKKYLKRILTVYFKTFVRADGRGAIGITKNIHDYSWRREEWRK